MAYNFQNETEGVTQNVLLLIESILQNAKQAQHAPYMACKV
jgi:hypothetical protein